MSVHEPEVFGRMERIAFLVLVGGWFTIVAEGFLFLFGVLPLVVGPGSRPIHEPEYIPVFLMTVAPVATYLGMQSVAWSIRLAVLVARDVRAIRHAEGLGE